MPAHRPDAHQEPRPHAPVSVRLPADCAVAPRFVMTPTETELERETLRLLAARGEDKTICPSEVARALGGDDWRSLMDAARAAAGRLADAGEVEITQAGAVVDLSSARGPVRIRRRRGTATAGE